MGTRTAGPLRERMIAQVQTLLRRHGAPRSQMTLMVIVTGLAGFLFSVILLHLGLSCMWFRYSLSIILAYLVFLACIWFWLARHRRELRVSQETRDSRRELRKTIRETTVDTVLDVVDIVEPFPRSSTKVASQSAENAGQVAEKAAGAAFSLDEYVVIAAALAALGSALAASAYTVYMAPTLLAEVFVDGVLATGFYHRLRRLESFHWTRSAFRGTWVQVSIVVAFFAVAAAIMHLYAPEADSIGDVLRHMAKR